MKRVHPKPKRTPKERREPNRKTQVRLAKLIAERTPLSRRSAEKAISNGRVSVNGRGAHIGQVVSDDCAVTLDGKPVRRIPKSIYILFNKPRGLVVTKSDSHGGETIWKFLSNFRDSVNYAGRLDKDSEGALILSSDGDFIYRLTHPKFEIEKTYVVRVGGRITPAILNRLKDGLKLRDGIARARSARKVADGVLELVLAEGRKREVRRMCKALGLHVERLQRTRIGPIELEGLKPGEWRHLNEDEVNSLNKEY